MPNIPETLIAFLATASIGAVWATCAPEFGPRSVIARFGIVEPKVLLTVAGYRYGERPIDRRADVASIRAALPTLERVVHVPYIGGEDDTIPDATGWEELLAEPAPLRFESVPFDHPLCVLFSSGTTGLPKAIVHGHGGLVVEHFKNHGLSWDLQPGDRLMWFSTTAWMMWNALIAALLLRTSIVMIDGNPVYPDLEFQWRLAAETEATMLGLSPAFLMACRKAGIKPAERYDLSRLRQIGAAGSPLPAEGFDWIYEQLGPSVLLNNGSGGTDVCTGIVQGSPLQPVYRGEIAGSLPGRRHRRVRRDGNPVTGELGELVIRSPMPSMPVGFWNDPGDRRYHAAYFEHYRGVWRHGDWIVFSERGSCVITGRSDATLNRGGVRLGTGELYAVVEEFPEVLDSLIVHLEDPEGGPGELLLFVVLRDNLELDDELRTRIATGLREALSPRHVPDTIEAVPAIPRTFTAKKLELPVKRILQGRDPRRSRAATRSLSPRRSTRSYRLPRGGAAPRWAASLSSGPAPRFLDGRSRGQPYRRLRGNGSGVEDGDADPQARGLSQPAPELGAQARRVDRAVRRLALHGELIHRPAPLENQLVVRRCALDPEQHVLDCRRMDVDTADDQHVVATAAHAGHADSCTSACASLAHDGPDVAGPVADQRHRLLRQRREHELTLGPRRERGSVVGIDHLDEEVVLLHVQPGLHPAFRGHSRPAHLRESVEVDRAYPEHALDLTAHLLGPRFAAEQRQLERELGDVAAGVQHRLRDHERIRRRGDKHLCLEVAQQRRLARREAARHRHDRGTEPLASLMEAETTREQAVTVGVVDQHPRSYAGHRHAPRHQLRPVLEVGARVADDGGAAVGPARRVHTYKLLAGDREQSKRVVLAQVGLDDERDARELVQRADVAGGGDPGLPQALGSRRLGCQHPRHGAAQPLELEGFELLPRERLDRVSDVRLRLFGGAHSSVAPSWRRARG